MVDEDIFSNLSFPVPIEVIFTRVISIGWYDGTTSGLAFDSLRELAFRFDLLDWGPCQDLRIFALSPLSLPQFEQTVKLFSTSQAPKWPIWYPSWPSDPLELKRMGSERDAILSRASRPEFSFASQSRFETVLTAKRLTLPSRAFLPAEFDEHGSGGFDYWQKFLELAL
jgi:hypothetical protein